MDAVIYRFYRHKSLISNKSYIGVTSQSIHERFLAHLSVSRSKSQTKFSRALRKYGATSWESTELCSTTKKELVLLLEKFYINYYDTYRYGYNSNPGGYGVLFHTDETKQKMSRPGIENPMFGKSRPDLILRNLINNPAKDEKARNKISKYMKESSPARGKPAWNTGLKMVPRKYPLTIVECPHCFKRGGKNIMSRWHFTNCNQKPI